MGWGLILVLALALVLGLGVVRNHQATVAERLSAMAQLRQVQLGEWLRTRMGEGRFLAGSPLWAELLVAVDGDGPEAGFGRLQGRAAAYGQLSGLHAAWVFDGTGQRRGEGPQAGPVPPGLRLQVQQAARDRELRWSGPYAPAQVAGDAEPVVLDLLLPLQRTGSPAQAVVVLRWPLGEAVAPLLRDWPAAGVPGRTVLWLRSDEQWLGLAFGADGQRPQVHRRMAPPTPATAAIPAVALDTSPASIPTAGPAPAAAAAADDAPAGAMTAMVQVLAQPALAGRRLHAPDLDGRASHAMLVPVVGTGWWLELSVDRGQADRALWGWLGLVALLAGLTLLAIWALLRLQAHRQALQLTQGLASAQSERLRTQARLQTEVTAQRDHLEAEVAVRTRGLREANAALEQAQGLLQTMADLLPGRLLYLDRGLRCRFANRGWLDWYGQSLESAIGRSAAELVTPESGPETVERLQEALRGQAHRFERITWRDGRRWVHQLDLLPDQQGDQVLGVTVMAIDISALKDAEEALVRSRDAAESASRAKSAFLANVSHEIRTPLNAVIGLTHLMRRESVDERQQGRLARLSAAADHLLNLVNDVLDLSRIESGKLTLEQQVFEFQPLLVNCLALVRDAASQKGLSLVLEEGNWPDRVVGDPMRLSQALVNLLANAVKFTDQGEVRLTALTLASEPQRVQLRFEVHDTGIGIAEDDRVRLFQAFEQADSSITRRHGGTGLGLALTQQIAGLMEGELGVDSQPGHGSCFWLTVWLGLPQALAAQANPALADAAGAGLPPGESAGQSAGLEPAAPGAAPPAEVSLAARVRATRAGRRVLVVDDQPVNREVVRALLEQAGLQVEEAADGQQAVARLGLSAGAAARIDLVLMDVQMPGTDGFSAARAIRQQPGNDAASLPIIAVTAHALQEARLASRAAGMNGHLVKPVRPELLFARLLECLPPNPAAAASAPTPADAGAAPAAPAASPEDEAGSALMQRLRSVAGLDADELLQRLGGNQPTMQKALALYARQCSSGLQMAAQMPVDAAGWRRVAELAHGWRGSALTIGAQPLQAAARRLETAARSAAEALLQPGLAGADPLALNAGREALQAVQAMLQEMADSLSSALSLPLPAGTGHAPQPAQAAPRDRSDQDSLQRAGPDPIAQD